MKTLTNLAMEALEVTSRLEKDRARLEELKAQIRAEALQRGDLDFPFRLAIPGLGLITMTRETNGNLRIGFKNS